MAHNEDDEDTVEDAEDDGSEGNNTLMEDEQIYNTILNTAIPQVQSSRQRPRTPNTIVLCLAKSRRVEFKGSLTPRGLSKKLKEVMAERTSEGEQYDSSSQPSPEAEEAEEAEEQDTSEKADDEAVEAEAEDADAQQGLDGSEAEADTSGTSDQAGPSHQHASRSAGAVSSAAPTPEQSRRATHHNTDYTANDSMFMGRDDGNPSSNNISPNPLHYQTGSMPDLYLSPHMIQQQALLPGTLGPKKRLLEAQQKQSGTVYDGPNDQEGKDEDDVPQSKRQRLSSPEADSSIFSGSGALAFRISGEKTTAIQVEDDSPTSERQATVEASSQEKGKGMGVDEGPAILQQSSAHTKAGESPILVSDDIHSPSQPVAGQDPHPTTKNVLSPLNSATAWLTASSLTRVAGMLSTLDPHTVIIDPALLEVRLGDNHKQRTQTPQALHVQQDPAVVQDGRLFRATRLQLHRPDPPVHTVIALIHLSDSKGRRHHWTVARCDLAQRTVEIADSMSGQDTMAASRTAVQFLVEQLIPSVLLKEGETGIAAEANDWASWTCTETPCAQQVDSHNCGVFALVFVWHWILGKSLPGLDDTVDPLLWRSIFRDLESSSASQSANHSSSPANSNLAVEPTVLSWWYRATVGLLPEPISIPASSLGLGPSSAPREASTTAIIPPTLLLSLPEQQNHQCVSLAQSLGQPNERQLAFYSSRITHLQKQAALASSAVEIAQQTQDQAIIMPQKMDNLLNRIQAELKNREALVNAYRQLLGLKDESEYSKEPAQSLLPNSIGANDNFKKELEAYEFAKGRYEDVRTMRRFWSQWTQDRVTLLCRLKVLLDVGLAQAEADLKERIGVNEKLVAQLNAAHKKIQELNALLYTLGNSNTPAGHFVNPVVAQ